MPNSASANAHISFEDPEFANAFCQQLALRSASDPAYSDLTSQPVVPKLPSWAAVRRISCKKVIVSWYRPTRVVWLNSRDQHIARRVREKFNSSRYLIGGRQPSASAPEVSGSTRSTTTWTVLLHNVPSDANKMEIERSIWSKADKPRHIELSPVAEPYDVESAPTLVHSSLTRIGPVEFKLDLRDHDKRFKVVAQFADKSDAREAKKTLHDQRQDFLKQGKLLLQLMSSSKFKVSVRVYDCVKEHLDAHAVEWRKRHVAFRIYPNPSLVKHFVNLKVEGG